MQGQTFSGKQSLANNLIDEVVKSKDEVADLL
jgi:hypothetical protein